MLTIIRTSSFSIFGRKRPSLVRPRSHCRLAMGDKSLNARCFADSIATRWAPPRGRKDTIVPVQRFCGKSIDSDSLGDFVFLELYPDNQSMSILV